MAADVRLILGDCLDKMAEIAPGSVDMVLCDPPYGTVEGIGAADNIDHGMKGRTGWDTALDPAAFLPKCNDALRKNGVMLLFAQEPYTSRLVTQALPNLPFTYRMVWVKDHFANALVAKTAPVSHYEDMVVFAKRHTKHDFGGEHPLREYAEKVIAYIGIGLKQVNTDLAHRRAEHFFYVGTTQFGLCTEGTYDQLSKRYGLRSMPGFREYSDLKSVNDLFRADLVARMAREHPKVFNLPEGKRFKSNVFHYRKDYGGFHPTQKPVALLEDLIRTYTNKGDTVLDFTMGSGSTGVACVNTGRAFIGIERDPAYFAIAEKRIAEVQRQPMLLAAE